MCGSEWTWQQLTRPPWKFVPMFHSGQAVIILVIILLHQFNILIFQIFGVWCVLVKRSFWQFILNSIIQPLSFSCQLIVVVQHHSWKRPEPDLIMWSFLTYTQLKTVERRYILVIYLMNFTDFCNYMLVLNLVPATSLRRQKTPETFHR